jgi:hypothetical protein
LLLQGSRLLSAPDGTPCGLGASASLLGGALLLLRGRLPRNWLPRFRGSLGLYRHYLSIIRINRLYLGLYGVLLPLGRRLQAAIFLLLLGRRLQATILLLLLGRQLQATIFLLPLGRQLQATILLLSAQRKLQATILLLPLGRRLQATILLLLDGVLLPEGPPLLLVGTDDLAISAVEACALAHAPATDCGASPRAVSSP